MLLPFLMLALPLSLAIFGTLFVIMLVTAAFGPPPSPTVDGKSRMRGRRRNGQSPQRGMNFDRSQVGAVNRGEREANWPGNSSVDAELDEDGVKPRQPSPRI